MSWSCISVYHILALSVERYLEVVHPIWHKLHVTRAKVVVTILIVWLFGFTYKYAYILPTTRVVNGVCSIANFYPSVLASTVGGLMNCFVDFIFPLILILFCYIRMWRRLRNKVKPHFYPTALSSEARATNTSMSRARRNILKTLVIIVSFFIGFNAHKQLLMLMKFLHIVVLDLSSVNFNISQILSFMNATIEPYIYLLCHREFQIGFRKLFKHREIRVHESSCRETKDHESSQAKVARFS